VTLLDNELTLLMQALSSIESFETRYAKVIRDAMDYVIDAERMKRKRLAEAEKAEKTIFGMKVEAYLRHEFQWDKGKTLDFYFADVEFDSKATIGKTWMVPPEAVGKICLLTLLDEDKGIYRAGLLRANLDMLTAGSNQDKKRSVSSAGRASVHWLIAEGTIPDS